MKKLTHKQKSEIVKRSLLIQRQIREDTWLRKRKGKLIGAEEIENLCALAELKEGERQNRHFRRTSYEKAT